MMTAVVKGAGDMVLCVMAKKWAKAERKLRIELERFTSTVVT